MQLKRYNFGLMAILALLMGVQQPLTALPASQNFLRHRYFPGLNNLNDLSIDPVASTLLGCDEAELDFCFSPLLNGLLLI